MEPEGTGKTTTYSSQLVDYVASKEAFRAQAYNNGKTIGYGFDFYFYLYPEVEINYNDDGVTITKEEGLRLKGIILDQSRDQINTYLDSNSLTVDQNTFDALTDLFYNRNSNQLTKEVAYAMAMKNDEEVKRLFSDFDYRYAMKYIYNGDEVESQAYVDRNPGLVTRREEEYSIYKNGYVNIP
jgi:GH24 family phage-related lysozyme (muramidase)